MTTSFYSALNYGDLSYGQPYNESFCKRIESLQIQTCLGWGISKIYHILKFMKNCVSNH